MDLKEAKELLKEGIVNSVGNKKTGMAESCKEYQEAITTILQELDNLQKENEELKENIERENKKKAFGTIAEMKLEDLIKNDYISKDKIKDCLDDIENYFENVSVPYEDIEFIKEKRNDLLKE